jgi:uncharacterized protein YndB with AHSA1/START domain
MQPRGCAREGTVDRVERRIELPVPPAEVWPDLSEAPRLSAWFGAEVDMDARAGGRATFRWPDGRVRGAVVEAADPDRLLVFRWLPFETAADGRREVVGPGRVELEVEPSGRGSVLSVREWGAEPATSSGMPA